jgi:hypothetical protein
MGTFTPERAGGSGYVKTVVHLPALHEAVEQTTRKGSARAVGMAYLRAERRNP